jgi:chaperone modulatory protein CbpM
MQPQPPDWIWLDARETVTSSELSQVCGLSLAELDELVDYGALAPVTQDDQRQFFSADWVPPLRVAIKLRQDFDLDLFTVAMLLGYLTRIETLERQVNTLKAKLPGALPAHLASATGIFRSPQ